MVTYAYLRGARVLRREFRRVLRGFTLLEIILVLFVLGLLAAALAPAVRDIVEHARREAEGRSLDELAATITTSFENTDLTKLNVAALPGTVGPTDAVTAFSSTTVGQYSTTGATDWFAKVARLRGIVPLVGVAPAGQPALLAITNNSLGNPRWLFAGPAEAGQQRFLLISLMGSSDQFIVPAYDSSPAWFEGIWNGDWESRTATVPADWSGRLTAPQLAAWADGSAGMTQTHRLCVRRIVLRKYQVTVNNNHPTDSAFVSYNNVSPAFTAAANSGANITPEILGGRLITVNRGPSLPGVQALQFWLRENATITVQ
jgi:prepilin-type N-terminal cleavage/methylation domain-containing protein